MQEFPKSIQSMVLHLRTMVAKIYGNKAINIDSMFNVAVCNYYTEDRHQISAHKDDERWLELNELDKSNNPCASIIASLTMYVDEIPDILRKFEIYNETDKKWISHPLEHNSVIFFSNHQHRAKNIGKRGKSCKRINLTFRTLSPGLLGLTGYGNFYRYMSIPHTISCVNDKHIVYSSKFIESSINSNLFIGKSIFTENIVIEKVSNEYRKQLKSNIIEKYNINLPRYIKSLCTVENYVNFTKTKSKSKKKFIIKKLAA